MCHDAVMVSVLYVTLYTIIVAQPMTQVSQPPSLIL